MSDYEQVDEGVIEVRYSIFAYKDSEGKAYYDWKTQSGDSSDEWFETVEDATRDVENHFT